MGCEDWRSRSAGATDCGVSWEREELRSAAKREEEGEEERVGETGGGEIGILLLKRMRRSTLCRGQCQRGGGEGGGRADGGQYRIGLE